MNNNFMNAVNYTSDHVLRYITVNINNQSIEGYTFNLLERCYECCKIKGHSNNPLKISESSDDYVDRKLKQFEQLSTLEDKWFGLLQEADFLFPSKYILKRENNPNAMPEWLPNTLQKVKTHFEELLLKMDWGMTIYEDKEIAILHNKKKIQPLSSIPKSHLHDGRYNVVMSNVYYAPVVDQNIVIGSLHLNYGVDYTESMPELLNNLINDNCCVILGGDTNHPPSFKMCKLLTNGDNIPTNFQTNYQILEISKLTPGGNKYNMVLLNDERDTRLAKAYDGFFVKMNKELSNDTSIVVHGEHKWGKKYNPEFNNEYVTLMTDNINKLYLATEI